MNQTQKNDDLTKLLLAHESIVEQRGFDVAQGSHRPNKISILFASECMNQSLNLSCMDFF